MDIAIFSGRGHRPVVGTCANEAVYLQMWYKVYFVPTASLLCVLHVGLCDAFVERGKPRRLEYLHLT